jgi:membrane protein
LKKLKLPSIAEIKNYFSQHSVWLGLLKYSKENSFIGFHGVPIYDVIVFVYHETLRDDLFTRANSVAFSFFLSLFPSLLTIFTLVPFALNALEVWYPGLKNFQSTLDEEISQVMPGQAGEFVLAFVQEITNSPRLGLLSFGFLLAVYFSSNGILALMQAFDKSYVKTFKRRNWVMKRLIGAGLTLLVGLFIVSSTVFVIMGDSIIYWISEGLNLGSSTAFFIGLVRWIIMLSLYYITIGTLYRYGASTIKKFSYFSPGVTLATVLSLATSVAFSFYIDGFDRYDTYIKFYGSIATIIIVMLWLQLNALILIIGFELNAAIAVRRDLTLVEEEE